MSTSKPSMSEISLRNAVMNMRLSSKCRLEPDVTILTGGSGSSSGKADSAESTTVMAHKFMLVAQSPVLMATLTCGMAETKSNTIDMTEFSRGAVLAFVNFLYGYSCSKDALNMHGSEIMCIANKYDVPYLFTECVEYYSSVLTVTNALAILEHADRYHSDLLFEKVLDFLMKHPHVLTAHGATDQLDEELLRKLLIGHARRIESDVARFGRVFH